MTLTKWVHAIGYHFVPFLFQRICHQTVQIVGIKEQMQDMISLTVLVVLAQRSVDEWAECTVLYQSIERG